MTATLRLPRVLAMTANIDLRHLVAGDTVASVLESLFDQHPGLRNHLLDDNGGIRPHVSVFVDGRQANLTTPVADGAEVYVLQAVSGG
jgi:molybdopterin converting factor small subunit